MLIIFSNFEFSICRSKPELLKALGEHYDLTAFDYMTGKINPLLLKTKAGNNSSHSTSHPEGNKRKSTPNGNRSVKLTDLLIDLGFIL